MKSAIAGIAFALGCGGGQKVTPATPPPVEDTPDAAAEEEEEEPPPPAPKVWRARAALTPVKGTKIKPALVSFSQSEGALATVAADTLDGAKPGTYWLVIHDGAACGPNGTKAGPPWPGGKDAQLKIVIGKDLTGDLEESEAKLVVDSEMGVGAVGHVLVLHDDKKGKPGKVLACGAIEAVDDE